MILHIGNGVYVPLKDVVAILDMEATQRNEATRIYFETTHQKGTVVHVSKSSQSSLVLTTNRNGDTLYASPLSVSTLLRRANRARDYYAGDMA